jgi:hypothetical protein
MPTSLLRNSNICSTVCAISAARVHPRTCAPPEAPKVIELHSTPLYSNDQPDRWLMQTVFEHSSSHPAREAAAAWVDAYDAALSLGAAVSKAQVLADAAYRATATMAGLPTGDWRRQ